MCQRFLQVSIPRVAAQLSCYLVANLMHCNKPTPWLTLQDHPCAHLTPELVLQGSGTATSASHTLVRPASLHITPAAACDASVDTHLSHVIFFTSQPHTCHLHYVPTPNPQGACVSAKMLDTPKLLLRL
jgi:hypothetical protein